MYIIITSIHTLYTLYTHILCTLSLLSLSLYTTLTRMLCYICIPPLSDTSHTYVSVYVRTYLSLSALYTLSPAAILIVLLGRVHAPVITRLSELTQIDLGECTLLLLPGQHRYRRLGQTGFEGDDSLGG